MVSRNYIITVPLIGFLWMLVFSALHVTEAQIGVCYGTQGNNLPKPSEVINLYGQYNIQRMRLYDPYDKSIFEALSGTNIEVMLGLPNDDLQSIATNHENAVSWVQNNIKNYPRVKFRYIVVGNEVSPLRDTSQFVPFVLPAMHKIHNQISLAGLASQIKVTTAVETGLTTNTSPPSNGEFKPEVRKFISPIIDFLVKYDAPLLVNIYPYFALAGDHGIPLYYALFRSQTNNNGYQNLFFAMLDATYSALEKAGAGSIEIVVSETGWPTRGGYQTTLDNARIYNSNLIQKVKSGSPKRPGKPIKTYIFSLFNENGKRGDEIERHWGLFSPNKQPKYQINFN